MWLGSSKGCSDVPGVAKASVNLATERATLSYDAEQVGVEALVTTIRDLGYDVPPQKLTLSIGGMSCASCVAKVEQGLFAVPGVIRASVNLATEQAVIETPPAVQVEDLRRAVEARGYTATPMGETSPDYDKAAREREIRRLGRKALVGALLSVPLMLGSFPRGSRGCRG